MLKVGFILDLSQSWLGGVNYYRNLFQAVEDYGKGIELIAFTSKDSDTSCLKDFPAGIDIFTTGLLTKWHPLWFTAHVCRRYLGKDFITSWFMKNHAITILSHNNSGIEYPGVRNIAWIPDFQHKYLPEFFQMMRLWQGIIIFLTLPKHLMLFCLVVTMLRKILKNFTQNMP